MPSAGGVPARVSVRAVRPYSFRRCIHQPRRGTVVRQEPLDRLLDEMSAKLVLVTVPARWGKASLLRGRCASGEVPRTAWLSVDQGDNDPARFWAGVIATLRTAWPARDPDRRPILRNRYAACGALSAGAEPLRSNSLCGALHLHD